jgi:hypothetical protein
MGENESPCRDLHDLLTGKLRVSWFSGLKELLDHWHHCEECQVLLPKAAEYIEHVESSWLFQIRKAIEQLHRDYNSEKQTLMQEESARIKAESEAFEELHPTNEIITFQGESQPPPSPDVVLHGKFLSLLSEKGEAIREQLEDMNDAAGLDYFRLVSEEGSCEYYSSLCSSLVASLPKETQNFVFKAILTADIEFLFKDGFPANCGLAFHHIVERAAPGFLRIYFQRDRPDRDEREASFLDNSGTRPLLPVSEGIERLASDFTELKAGQMETIRILEHKRYEKREIVEDLQNLLGKELFMRLHAETRRYLQMAERYFRGGAELDDFVPSIHNFQRAYESEFGQRITRPLVQNLVQKGFNQYGLRDGRVPQLIQGGQLSRLGLGQQLTYLRDDKLVRDILSTMGFELNAIVDSALALNKTRNKATHGTDCSHTEASRVRDMLLGPHTGLKALFPKNPSQMVTPNSNFP